MPNPPGPDLITDDGLCYPFAWQLHSSKRRLPSSLGCSLLFTPLLSPPCMFGFSPPPSQDGGEQIGKMTRI